jgi:hypothetical protein
MIFFSRNLGSISFIHSKNGLNFDLSLFMLKLLFLQSWLLMIADRVGGRTDERTDSAGRKEGTLAECAMNTPPQQQRTSHLNTHHGQ